MWFYARYNDQDIEFYLNNVESYLEEDPTICFAYLDGFNSEIYLLTGQTNLSAGIRLGTCKYSELSDIEPAQLPDRLVPYPSWRSTRI